MGRHNPNICDEGRLAGCCDRNPEAALLLFSGGTPCSVTTEDALGQR